MYRLFIPLLIIIAFFPSCRGVRTQPGHTVFQEKERSHVLAVFMDGTRDKPHKNQWRNSHVKTMHDLALPEIRSLYIEGVGAGNRLKQAAKAITTRERVMTAYRFLSEHYTDKERDSICLFGFSRGANQCRILASVIYTIGIINLDTIKTEKDKEQFLLQLYDAYVDTAGAPGKKYKVAGFINRWNRNHPGEEVVYDTAANTMIELLALWDTVEAFERDRCEKTIPTHQHLNQLYNVKKLFHAVSLDDNRAYTYTPILATHKDVALHPHQKIENIVEEVWFNGSHKQVGGGVRNKSKAKLAGVSLQWMLSKLKPYHIFREPKIELYPLTEVGNMRANRFLRLLSPGDTLRAIDKYRESMHPAFHGRIKVHHSVIDRLAAGVVQDFKMRGREDWYDWNPFRHCFTRDGNKRKFHRDCMYIEQVYNGEPVK